MASSAKFERWLNNSGVRRNNIVQIKYNAYTPLLVSSSSSTYTQVESLTIEPFFPNSSIIIIANYGVSGLGSMKLQKNGIDLTISPTGGNAYQFYSGQNGSSYDGGSPRSQFKLFQVDSATTNKSVTYSTHIIAYPSSYSQFAINPNPYGNGSGTFSGFMLMEVTQ